MTHPVSGTKKLAQSREEDYGFDLQFPLSFTLAPYLKVFKMGDFYLEKDLSEFIRVEDNFPDINLNPRLLFKLFEERGPSEDL